MTNLLPDDPTVVLTGRVLQRLMFLWRHTAHVVVGAVVAYLVAKFGLGVSAETQTLAETLLFGAGISAYGWVQHWLETRTGTAWWARAARGAARLMVLGAPGVVAYGPPAA